MRKLTIPVFSVFLSALALGVSMLAIPVSQAAELSDAQKKGLDIVLDRKKGNCFACHAMEHAVLPQGNIGPPLVAMKQRFPDKVKLRTQIWDATVNNSDSLMPPFGRHQILTEQEIDQVVEFVHSL